MKTENSLSTPDLKAKNNVNIYLAVIELCKLLIDYPDGSEKNVNFYKKFNRLKDIIPHNIVFSIIKEYDF